MIQGFALGGEFGAAVLLVSEYGEPKKRGFWASWPQAGAPMGTVLATVVVSAIGLFLTDEAFDQWGGWRVAFLFAIPLLIIGFWVRRGVEESPVFKAAQEQAAKAPAAQERSSILEALSRPRAVLTGLGMRLGENIAFYVYTVFVIAYATTYFDFHRGDIIMAVTFASLFQFVGMIGGGAWSDRVGRKKAMLVPAIVLVVWAPVFFWLVQLESLPMLWSVCAWVRSSTACSPARKRRGSPSCSRRATATPVRRWSSRDRRSSPVPPRPPRSSRSG